MIPGFYVLYENMANFPAFCQNLSSRTYPKFGRSDDHKLIPQSANQINQSDFNLASCRLWGNTLRGCP